MREPVLALAITAAALFLLWLAPDVSDSALAPLALVLYVVAYGSGVFAALRAGAAAAVALGAFALAMGAAAGFAGVLAVAGPWWIGRQVRRRRELVRELAERTRELAAAENAFTRLSVQRERDRIARELHDIVAHHLAVIVVQAGAGRTASSAARAGERFAGIRQAGEEALAEMAHLIEVLDEEERRDLDALIARARSSGIDVELTLPSDVAVPEAAYRVVQEGLTNAIKHAPGSAVHVQLRLAAAALDVEVRNAAAAVPSGLARTGAGLGLTGMRERVEALGGTLEAGPDRGGWRLVARLPYPTGMTRRSPQEVTTGRRGAG
jgi:signal transduction histidine kinase